ncbi:ribose-5-phosphate isomerase A [Ktedonobacter sp. SOSP1-52]|uniref:ribose-5-phosphate isomerase RpiA n=1 Tax=Ktedonobacter sp. SOSP1-52 TaxID=2778366 RepID=UPI0019160E64|nr:ribose-5-phosphate isomerase RpiA [Ktedonobacter sp. SOSP1-52]GHO67079.1 ribose-5-phosphate isomerase A [Ktedonobacter sp. SOSP1-52]
MTGQEINRDAWKQAASEAAAQLVEDGMLVGLGTGSTAAFFIQALARRMQQGLHIAGTISSSLASQELAQSLHIPITDFATHPSLDIYIDGADEIDSQLNLVKGGGGALLREKIVASASRRFVVIADQLKLVQRLGQSFALPIEAIPFAAPLVSRKLTNLGATVKLRGGNTTPFITDNHNVILDCTFADGILDPAALDEQLHHVVGIVETGLFLGMAQQALIGGPHGVQVLP